MYPALSSIVAILAFMVFVHLTTPESVSVGLLAVPIVLIFIAVYSLCLLILTYVQAKKPRTRLVYRRGVLAFLVAISASLLIVFQSTGGIIWGDILLLLAIVVISVIYISRY